MRCFATLPLLLIVCLAAIGCEKEPNPTPKTTTDAGQTKTADTGAPADVGAKPEAPESRTIFNFVDNRHLAHLIDSEGALLMDMGSGGSLKYIQGGWNSTWIDPKKEGDIDFAYTRGVGGTIRFPLIANADLTGTSKDWKVQLRLRPVGNQRCDLFLRSTNGEEKKFASLTSIEDGWKTYTVTLPDGLQLGQEHTLRLHFSRSQPVDGTRAAAAIDWIRVGPNLTEAEPALPTFEDAAINLPKGTGLIWYTLPQKLSTLTADVDGKVSVKMQTTAALPEVTADKALNVPMDPVAGKATRIWFQAIDASKLKHLSIDAALLPEAKETKPPQVVLVWIIDTLRADHLKLYNPSTDVQTPSLDAFAKDAAVFMSATVQGNSSLPSSASVFTSAYAPNHGLITEKAKLPASSKLFGEAMKQAGWTTGLFSSNGYVSNSWGFARGFDSEVNPIRENRPSDSEYLWPETKTWMEAKLKADPNAKLFVYINTVDPHVPYDPPKAQLELYDKRTGTIGKVSPRGTGQLLHDMAKGSIKLSADEANYMRALYKGEITYNDLWFGKMLEDLKTLGVHDKTMVIVSSDHGEEFDEYGKFGHGISVNQELIDVPLLIGYPAWTKGGAKISDDVETVDIMPTALTAIGAPIPDSAQGASLADLILKPAVRHPRPAFSYHNTFLRSARLGSYKYQLFHGDKDPLYELKTPEDGKPWDATDVGDAQPIARRMMRDLMAFQVGLDDKLRKSKHGFPNNHSAEWAKTLDEIHKVK